MTPKLPGFDDPAAPPLRWALYTPAWSGITPETRATSQAAAQAVVPRAATQRAAVLAAIRQAGAQGCTDPELQAALHLDGSTERPRRLELLKAHLIVASGRTRRTTHGRAAVVWILSPG